MYEPPANAVVMSAVTSPIGVAPMISACWSAASTIVLTSATRGYVATRVASSAFVRATFCAVYAVTSWVAVSTVSDTCPMNSP
ncbi:Uncharacterised protein [Mycobacteroides abscessus]|nr:Uncharacterised protein [Mycobacteroides abscessus]